MVYPLVIKNQSEPSETNCESSRSPTGDHGIHSRIINTKPYLSRSVYKTNLEIEIGVCRRVFSLGQKQ